MKTDTWEWTIEFALDMLLMGQRWRQQAPRLLPAAAARLGGLLCQMRTLCEDSDDESEDPSCVTLPIQASVHARRHRPGMRGLAWPPAWALDAYCSCGMWLDCFAPLPALLLGQWPAPTGHPRCGCLCCCRSC